MDLNELFFRHQIALMRADRADSRDEARRLGALADCFASRISVVQRHLGAGMTPPAQALAL